MGRLTEFYLVKHAKARVRTPNSPKSLEQTSRGIAGILDRMTESCVSTQSFVYEVLGCTMYIGILAICGMLP